jgi:hypothetical protein
LRIRTDGDELNAVRGRSRRVLRCRRAVEADGDLQGKGTHRCGESDATCESAHGKILMTC